MLGLPKARNQRGEFRTVLLIERREFQSQSRAGLGVAHYRVGADLSFCNKEIQTGHCAHGPRLGSLNEQSAHAHVADERNIVASLALPAHPNVARCVNASSKSSGWRVAGLQSQASDLLELTSLL